MAGRVTLTPRAWACLIVMWAASVLVSWLSYQRAARVAAIMPSVMSAMDHRLLTLRERQDRKLVRLDRLMASTKSGVESMQHDQDLLHHAVTDAQERQDTQFAWQRRTGARLDRIEATLTEAKKTVEHVDRTVQHVTAPPPKPWWKPWQ